MELVNGVNEDGSPTKDGWFKVLNKDGCSSIRNTYQWNLPKQREDGSWRPGRWHHSPQPIYVCSRGLHLTTDPWDHWMVWGAQVYRAEWKGVWDLDEEEFENGGKAAFESVRLLEPVRCDWWDRAHRKMDELLAIALNHRNKPETDSIPHFWQINHHQLDSMGLSIGGGSFQDKGLKRFAAKDALIAAGEDARRSSAVRSVDNMIYNTRRKPEYRHLLYPYFSAFELLVLWEMVRDVFPGDHDQDYLDHSLFERDMVLWQDALVRGYVPLGWTEKHFVVEEGIWELNELYP